MKREMKAISLVLIMTIIMSLFVPMSVSAEESVSLNESYVELTIGDTANLVATVTGIDNYTLSWSTTNNTTASVSGDGVVSANTPGTATITATVTYTVTEIVTPPEGETLPDPDPEAPSDPITQEVEKTVSASCTVKVNAKPAATTAAPTEKKTTTKVLTNYSGTIFVSLQAGKTAQLDTSGLGSGVRYESGNSSVVRVSSSGLITGVKEGTTYIIAYNSTYQQKYQVTITKASETATVTVAGDATVPSELATVTIANSTTKQPSSGYIVYEGTTNENAGDNDETPANTKMRILIASIGIIAALIVLILVVYNIIRNKKKDNEEQYENVDIYDMNYDENAEANDEDEDVDFDSDDDDTQFYL